MATPLSSCLDIERHSVDDSRQAGGELTVLVEWCHRFATSVYSADNKHIGWTWAHGPSVTTELHVWRDSVAVISTPVPSHIEASLIAYVAGLFAADEEVAA